jgi:bacteriophage exclusion system BrxC/D-like protein
MTNTADAIRPRDRDAILQSLRAGVVPRIGQQHIQVGRVDEVRALLRDIERIADGGSAIRFVIGEYGSGKTFFLHLVRSIALEKRLVTAHADLSPDRRLHATGGQARSLFAELMRNLATRARPDGGALTSLVERFVSNALGEARELGVPPEVVIHARLDALSELVGGYDFAEVIAAYWRGHDTGNEQLKSDAVRWLRGEFSTRTEARAALGVRRIVDDASVYDHLKLMARFVRTTGYDGLLICLDELVNLYKLHNTQARNANYEQLLRILNDSLQGVAVGLGFLLGGTPEFLLDTRRGLYSYPALQSRLAENTFATGELVDWSSPVLRLANLTPEDFFVLLTKLRHVYASGDPAAYLLPDAGLTTFMQHCSGRVGDAYFRTPRTTIKEFVDLLAVLDQNPGASWEALIGQVELVPESNPDLAPLPEAEDEESDATGQSWPIASSTAAAGDDDLASFRL